MYIHILPRPSNESQENNKESLIVSDNLEGRGKSYFNYYIISISSKQRAKKVWAYKYTNVYLFKICLNPRNPFI